MESVGIFAAAKMAHLSDDKAVAKMGHPMVVVVRLDVSYPPKLVEARHCEENANVALIKEEASACGGCRLR